MYSEILQLVGVLAVFAVAIFLWFWNVYLPRRTMERWEGQRVVSRDEPAGPDDRNG